MTGNGTNPALWIRGYSQYTELMYWLISGAYIKKAEDAKLLSK